MDCLGSPRSIPLYRTLITPLRYVVLRLRTTFRRPFPEILPCSYRVRHPRHDPRSCDRERVFLSSCLPYTYGRRWKGLSPVRLVTCWDWTLRVLQGTPRLLGRDGCGTSMSSVERGLQNSERNFTFVSPSPWSYTDPEQSFGIYSTPLFLSDPSETYRFHSVINTDRGMGVLCVCI